MKTYLLRSLFIACSILVFSPARASHLTGGQMTYVYLGDSSSSGLNYYKYQVSLVIYEDCLNGSPDAIAQDNPAFLGVFYQTTMGYEIYEMDTFSQFPNAIFYSSSVTIPSVYANTCGSSTTTAACALKKTFIKTYALPASSTGYVISYQRCCWSASIVNINDPANDGMTISCTIPPTTIINNSVVFKSDPPQLACLNKPFFYDHSANDADGDSLSYGFSAALNGATNSSNSKPPPVPPPYDSLPYNAPYTTQFPLAAAPAFTIDPATGIITGTPNVQGRYLMCVACYEWRAGQLINKVTREFVVIVTVCDKNEFNVVAGPDTSVIAGASFQFYASPAATYTWSPSTYLSSSNIQNPIGTFNDPGIFIYTLSEVTDSGCDGVAKVEVQVLEYSNFTVPNAFTPNGDNLNDYFTPIPVLGSTLISLRVFDRKGIMVYNGGNNSPGWDGTYKGVNQDVGTYYWELLYYDNNGATRHMKGDVMLIR